MRLDLIERPVAVPLVLSKRSRLAEADKYKFSALTGELAGG